MEDIGHRTSSSETPKPCEYFELIGGTSTGGLIAIMLGLLGMVSLSSKGANPQTVNECIDEYLKLSREVFKIDQVLLGKIPVGND
jgi:patatin-like phospholipase/acyl hydrolase